ncbi:hypothetical protein L7F22_023271 [Adiantum nelumboides]|nr:hypothetical protein [Adiantum nelumboides]
MMNVLEQALVYHEDLERLLTGVLQAAMHAQGRSRRIVRKHTVRNMVDTIIPTAQRLIDTYNEEQRIEETIDHGHLFGAFYGDVKAILRRPACQPLESVDPSDLQLLAAVAVRVNFLAQLFSGEEAFGRFLRPTQPLAQLKYPLGIIYL